MHIHAQTQVELDRKAVRVLSGSDEHAAIGTSITTSSTSSITTSITMSAPPSSMFGAGCGSRKTYLGGPEHPLERENTRFCCPVRTVERENTRSCGPGRALERENKSFCGPGRTVDREHKRFCGPDRLCGVARIRR